MQATADNKLRHWPMANAQNACNHALMQQAAGHKALRKGRWSETGHAYLVTFTTHERQPWFRDPALAFTACRAIAGSLGDTAAFICWVLMPDHFHAILQLKSEAGLSRCVQRIKGCSSMACRKVLHQPMPIWARAFHDHAVRADEDLDAMARYVIANPVRAGLVAEAMQYPWWNADWL